MKEREALKLALEALERGETELRWKAITIAKEALAQPEQLKGLQLIHKADIDLAKKRATEAQPEQGPVAWYDTEEYGSIRWANEWSLDEGAPLYTTPPQRKPLTDEEIVDIVGNCAADSGGWFRYHALARAIEAAHGIKE